MMTSHSLTLRLAQSPHQGTQVPPRIGRSKPSVGHQVSSPRLSAQPTAGRCSRIRQLSVCAASKGFGAKADPTKAAGQTCPCGSRQFYRDCCEPYHTGKATPPTAEAQLKARFSAFVKGKEDYVVNTFHPTYLSFKYPGQTPGGSDDPAAMLKRDVKMACNSWSYSGLKVMKVEPGSNPDETFIEFSYKSSPKTYESRTGSRHTRVKAAPVERNLDGSVVVRETVERSRFLRDNSPYGWRFADYELISFPEHMAEAKDAELQSKAARGQ